MQEYYLKPNVKAEPLLWKWYGWSYLIPPITAGCNILERHIKTMQSYIQAPHVHAEATKNPSLIGGPFIDLSGEHVEEIKDLLIQTYRQCQPLIELSLSIKKLDHFLQNQPQGMSLEASYNEIPDMLKGYVELIYDLNHHPSPRLIEPLLYNTYYDNSAQSLALSLLNSDYRPFVLSTPRLHKQDEIHLNIPFSDERIDVLFKMRREPNEIKKLIELFNINEQNHLLFKSLFTETPPKITKDSNFRGEEVRIRYFGHACILIETKNISILIDPIISYDIPQENARYSYNDLPDIIDYVLITHNHQDHIALETLLQLRHKIKHIVVPSNSSGALADPSMKLLLKKLGFLSVLTIEEFDEINFPEGFISGIPFLGEHADLNIQSKISYFINIKGKKLLFLADSNNFEGRLYDHIFTYTGPIDIIFLGMECEGAPLSWLYGPLFSSPLKKDVDTSRRLSGSNSKSAWDIITRLKCKKAYIYAMGQEPWLSFIMGLNYTPESAQIKESNKFLEVCKYNGVEAERVYWMKEWLLNPS